MGGLGNQMFQYAIGRHFALKNNTQLLLDTSTFNKKRFRNFRKNKDTTRTYELNAFNISAKVTSKYEIIYARLIEHIFSKFSFLERAYVKQKNNYFDKKVLFNHQKNMYIEGFWQCEKYFEDIKDIIKQDFKIKIKPDKQNEAMLKKIEGTNSICVHIRRGDYATDPRTKENHGLCSLRYYYNSINFIKKRTKNSVFYIFSDDPNWVKNNLKIKDKTTFVDINGVDKAYEDLRLMSNCKHFITANSSFSWWAAWLSNNPNKIICAPKKWFNQVDEGDIVPKSWVRIKG